MKENKGGLSVKGLKKEGPIGDGIALNCIAHPPGLIDKIARAIRSGKLKTHTAKILPMERMNGGKE